MLSTEFKIGQRVLVDGEPLGVVTAITFRAYGQPKLAGAVRPQYEVSWVAYGDAKSAWFDEWRLSC